MPKCANIPAILTIGAALTIAAGAYAAEPSPYLGLEQRAVKALSAEQIDDLLAGRGAGYALAAELNGHPGPMHVIELAEQLHLTAEQRARVEASFAAMRAEAQAIGAEIVAAERALDAGFAAAQMDAAEMARRSEALGALYGRYRAAHLKAHLEMRALLTPAQIARYDALRGYADAAPAAPRSHRSHH